jgi:hypothetical protein
MRFMHNYIHHNLPFSCAQLGMFKRDHNQKWSVAKCRFGLRIPIHNSVRIYQAPPSAFFPLQIWKEQNDKKSPPPSNCRVNCLNSTMCCCYMFQILPSPSSIPLNRAGPMFYLISDLHETGTGPTWVPGIRHGPGPYSTSFLPPPILHCKDIIPKIRNKYSQGKELLGYSPSFQHSCFCERLIYSLIGLPILLLEK